MNINPLFVVSFVLLTLIHFAASIILESLAGIGIVSATLGYALHCKLFECCDDYYIPQNTKELYYEMNKSLYGQQIAQDIVYRAIKSHVVNPNSKKPLVLSFHGGSGIGKNYVASMIASSMFKLGEKSKYYYFFNGRADFPSKKTEMVDIYKLNLKEKIEQALSRCERSVFVFDEVDKIEQGVLDILVPFMDYTSWSKFDNKKAIFIFISNTGSGEIVKKMIEFWKKGHHRENITIKYFESLIELGAFNEPGGLYKSGTIEAKVIDYHIPFLPLEEKHVLECIKDVFKNENVHNPSKTLIKEAQEFVTYGPSPHNLYSTSGCKKLDRKVSSLLHKGEFND